MTPWPTSRPKPYSANTQPQQAHTFSIWVRVHRELRTADFPMDEVVHGKGLANIGKMPGDEWQKVLPTCGLLLGYMWAHPGPRSCCSWAGDFGQENASGSHGREPRVARVAISVARRCEELGGATSIACIARPPALYELDFSGDGFQWIDAKQRRHERHRVSCAKGRSGDNRTGGVQFPRRWPRDNYQIGVPRRRPAGSRGLNSDAAYYSGSDIGNFRGYRGGTTALSWALPLAESASAAPYRC